MSTHYEVTLNVHTSTKRDMDPGLFYVPAGSAFNSMECAKFYGLNIHAFDTQDIKTAQNKASHLSDDEYLEVSPVVTSI